MFTHPNQCGNCIFATRNTCASSSRTWYCRAGGMSHKPLLPGWWILVFGCSLFVNRARG